MSNTRKCLGKITVRNKLESNIENVRVLYGAGDKNQDHSGLGLAYWFDWKTVDLECRQNVVFTTERHIGDISSESQKSTTNFVCSTLYRGYWQLYWKIGNIQYKINKNNAQVNVWDMDAGRELEITIMKETDCIRADFKLPSGNAYFYAAVAGYT